jgi:hypothetical protein
MKLSKSLAIASVALMCAATGVMAQPGGGGGGGFGGNFDPAQFQQQRMERIRTAMGVTDDAEWKVIQDRATKVTEANQAVMSFRPRGGGRGGPGGGGGGGGGRGGNFQPSPEAESLRAAIENNAPADQIKAALQKYRDARKVKQAALEKAQADLKQVLSVKQEAVAVTQGLLD